MAFWMWSRNRPRSLLLSPAPSHKSVPAETLAMLLAAQAQTGELTPPQRPPAPGWGLLGAKGLGKTAGETEWGLRLWLMLWGVPAAVGWSNVWESQCKPFSAALLIPHQWVPFSGPPGPLPSLLLLPPAPLNALSPLNSLALSLSLSSPAPSATTHQVRTCTCIPMTSGFYHQFPARLVSTSHPLGSPENWMLLARVRPLCFGAQLLALHWPCVLPYHLTPSLSYPTPHSSSAGNTFPLGQPSTFFITSPDAPSVLPLSSF